MLVPGMIVPRVIVPVAVVRAGVQTIVTRVEIEEPGTEG